MVHIEDLGSHFDAPIETVWKFILSADDHTRSHASSRRNVHAEPAGENAMRLSWEQNVQGKWIKVVNRVTMFAPVAQLVHSVEGPLAGSKFLMTYAPKGNKTAVNVIGDFHSEMIPPAQLEPMVLGSLEEAFNDDSAAIREMTHPK
ncbi:MAG: hypothetical protein L3K06_00690 [Thermoplasmata archaeon]|nr:hypothetical protein [Thermoplasmata archaeon]MCI4353867.1 hypothetical protein [Thermoplasmata archaeon]